MAIQTKGNHPNQNPQAARISTFQDTSSNQHQLIDKTIPEPTTSRTFNSHSNYTSNTLTNSRLTSIKFKYETRTFDLIN
jgi:hypothetical protein